MRYPFLLLFNFFILLLSPPFLIHAAEIRVYDKKTIVLEGDIVEGDYDKILNVAKKVGPSLEKIFLASLGGNLNEAMRIGNLVRELRWSTEVACPVFISYEEYGFDPIEKKPIEQRKNDNIEYDVQPGMTVKGEFIRSENDLKCASSCFFIYAAGVIRSGGEIGIHRPFLNEESCSKISGNDAIDFSVSATQAIKIYLTEMGIPEHIYNTMLSISKNSIHWLTYEEKKEIEGYIPALKDWLDGKCGSTESIKGILAEMELKMGKDNPLYEKSASILCANWGACRQEAMREMRKEAWEKFFKKS